MKPETAWKHFDCWEQEFRQAASADDFTLFRNHLRMLGLPIRPKQMLEATIIMACRVIAFAIMDGQFEAIPKFLKMQTYDPAQSTDAYYTLTFDICHRAKAVGRLLVDKPLKSVDLAGLFGSPWNEYKTCGYFCFYVSRKKWETLTENQTQKLEELVAEDLLFDYTRDEIDFWFSESEDEKWFQVSVVDIH